MQEYEIHPSCKQHAKCPKCSKDVGRAIAKCPHCKTRRTHQDCYPEQYRHRLIGKRVKAPHGRICKVSRVVGSPFGPVAIMTTTQTAWLVKDCKVFRYRKLAA
jgi:hypothetical protein